MIYTKLTNKAMHIAYEAHKDQVDKAGLPYIYHPIHLAEQMDDEISVCVALLHDVVEDTGLSFNDLMIKGIPDIIIDTLKLLTKENNVPYLDYIQKIKESGNRIAIAVKVVDLRHNLDVSRLDMYDDKVFEQLAKYREAIEILKNCETRSVFIEREIGTGLDFYTLRIGDKCFYASKNQAPFPRSYSDPIQTDDLIHEKVFSTIKNPSYEDITIVPGLKLEFLVYENGNPNPIGRLDREYGDNSFFSSSAISDRYTIIDVNEEFPFGVHFVDKDVRGSSQDLKKIAVSIYPDDSFEYNSCSLVEERFIVGIDEGHFKWLHHIFHAFILRKNI